MFEHRTCHSAYAQQERRSHRLRNGLPSNGRLRSLEFCVRYFSQSWRAMTPKFNIDRLYDSAVARKWENYPHDWTADTASNPPENIDEHCSAIKNALFVSATQVVCAVNERNLLLRWSNKQKMIEIAMISEVHTASRKNLHTLHGPLTDVDSRLLNHADEQLMNHFTTILNSTNCFSKHKRNHLK